MSDERTTTEIKLSCSNRSTLPDPMGPHPNSPATVSPCQACRLQIVVVAFAGGFWARILSQQWLKRKGGLSVQYDNSVKWIRLLQSDWNFPEFTVLLSIDIIGRNRSNNIEQDSGLFPSLLLHCPACHLIKWLHNLTDPILAWTESSCRAVEQSGRFVDMICCFVVGVKGSLIWWKQHWIGMFGWSRCQSPMWARLSSSGGIHLWAYWACNNGWCFASKWRLPVNSRYSSPAVRFKLEACSTTNSL